jgi:prepilin-type N-terminal cleavage/methylation domain-containing protein/prepilin-type processing-associated H-X9-DG protein
VRHRRGFTLIELLVVISVMGVLIALLLPAVQQAREASRRAQCANNLKQIGIAILEYESARRVLPPGYVSGWDAREEKETGPGWGWAAMVLPQMDQQPLFNQVDFSRQINDPVNMTVRLTQLGTFFCPSDDMPRTWLATSGTVVVFHDTLASSVQPICDVVGANYVGVFGIGEPGVDGNGVFYRNSAVRMPMITDGASHTLMVGERSTRCNLGRGRATWLGKLTGSQFWSCNFAGTEVDPDAGATCVTEDGSGMVLGHTGEGHGPSDIYGDTTQFHGRHDRGANFAFCDGHVAWLKGTMNYNVFKALSTRAGREVISEEY